MHGLRPPVGIRGSSAGHSVRRAAILDETEWRMIHRIQRAGQVQGAIQWKGVTTKQSKVFAEKMIEPEDVNEFGE